MKNQYPHIPTTYDYEITKGVLLRVESTGNRDTTCPKAPFSRIEYKVVNYNGYPCTFPNDLIYDLPCNRNNFVKVA